MRTIGQVGKLLAVVVTSETEELDDALSKFHDVSTVVVCHRDTVVVKDIDMVTTKTKVADVWGINGVDYRIDVFLRVARTTHLYKKGKFDFRAVMIDAMKIAVA